MKMILCKLTMLMGMLAIVAATTETYFILKPLLRLRIFLNCGETSKQSCAIARVVAFAVDAVIVLPASIIVGGFVYGLFGCIIFATLSQIPIEILVYQKNKEEARAAKLMSEG